MAGGSNCFPTSFHSGTLAYTFKPLFLSFIKKLRVFFYKLSQLPDVLICPIVFWNYGTFFDVLILFLLIKVSILSLSVAGNSVTFAKLYLFLLHLLAYLLDLLACLLHLLASPPHFLQLLALFFNGSKVFCQDSFAACFFGRHTDY